MKLAHAGLVIGLLMVGVGPRLVQAVDLTGTWIGKIACDTFDDTGKSKDAVSGDIMQITQTGVDLNMTADGFTYDGKVIDDPVNPIQKGQATFIECETTPANTGTSEIGRTKIIVVKPDGIGATFTAQSILSGGGTVFQTCRWNYKRVDTADPGVPECSAVPLSRTAPTTGHRSR